MSESIHDLRGILFATLRAVQSGEMELDRAKAVSDLSQTIINTAKVEVEYERVTGRKIATQFLPTEQADSKPYRLREAASRSATPLGASPVASLGARKTG